MADSSLKAPLSSQQDISQAFLPNEWSTALKLDYLDKSQTGGPAGERILKIGRAVFDLQETVEGIGLASITVNGLVLQAAGVPDANQSTVNIVTANLLPPGAAYAQAYAQLQSDLINELKAAVNQLKLDLNAAIINSNNALVTERAAKQRQE